MLKDRVNFVPGGFQVYIAETNFTSTPHIGFDATVEQVRQHRLANPRFGWATDTESIATWVDQFTEARLRSTYGNGANSYLIGASAGPPANPLWRPLRARAVDASAAVGAEQPSKVKVGVGLLMDFLGPSMKAVPASLSEKRASICVVCPANQKGDLVTHLGGLALKLMLQMRSDLKLATSHDAKLHDCAVCECNLHLKPHVALDFILERTTPEQMEKFPEACWIKRKDK